MPERIWAVRMGDSHDGSGVSVITIVIRLYLKNAPVFMYINLFPVLVAYKIIHCKTVNETDYFLVGSKLWEILRITDMLSYL